MQSVCDSRNRSIMGDSNITPVVGKLMNGK